MNMTKELQEMNRALSKLVPAIKNDQIGTVSWFHDVKGFGWIKDATGQDVFVHYTAIYKDGYKTLTEGQNVLMDIIDGPKGPQASNVRTCF
jgi:CspA family cold shock protein